MGCAVHTVDLRVDPGDGPAELVANVLEKRLFSVGARKVEVRVDGEDVIVSLHEDDQARLEAVLASGVLSFGWEEEEPFLDRVIPKNLLCVDTANTVQWALSLSSFDADTIRVATTLNDGRVLVIAVDGTPVATPTIDRPITGGTAMVELEMGYRDCRVLSARIIGGPLPERVQLR